MTINMKLQQKIALGVMLSLLIMVFITFIYTLWQWHNDWKLTHEEQNTSPIVAKANSNDLLINKIADAHLFGKAPVKNIIATEIPISSLQLLVTGIVKQNGAASKVYISRAGAPSKIYKIGDVVTSGVKIYDINADTIILENHGQMEKLPLSRQKLEFKPRVAPENP